MGSKYFFKFLVSSPISFFEGPVTITTRYQNHPEPNVEFSDHFVSHEPVFDGQDEERQQLWAKSQQVQSFDLFLSHTWHAPGSRKVGTTRANFWLFWMLSSSLLFNLFWRK